MTHHLSASAEDYLETILEIGGSGQAVRSVDIAGHLQVSKASVNKAMKLLQEAGLIDHAHYGQIQLTAAGQRKAEEVLRRHTMLKRFLVEVLGINEQTAEQDACRMEHAISEETRDKWLAYLQQVL